MTEISFELKTGKQLWEDVEPQKLDQVKQNHLKWSSNSISNSNWPICIQNQLSWYSHSQKGCFFIFFLGRLRAVRVGFYWVLYCFVSNTTKSNCIPDSNSNSNPNPNPTPTPTPNHDHDHDLSINPNPNPNSQYWSKFSILIWILNIDPNSQHRSKFSMSIQILNINNILNINHILNIDPNSWYQSHSRYQSHSQYQSHSS